MNARTSNHEKTVSNSEGTFTYWITEYFSDIGEWKFSLEATKFLLWLIDEFLRDMNTLDFLSSSKKLSINYLHRCSIKNLHRKIELFIVPANFTCTSCGIFRRIKKFLLSLRILFARIQYKLSKAWGRLVQCSLFKQSFGILISFVFI